MKETIYTIPLNDAFHADDECPFCYLEREAEQHALEFILGSGASYMEDDIRMETDKIGFCRHHYKMMYDYGNRLGSGLILSTHMKKLNQEMAEQMKAFKSGKSTLMGRMKKTDLNQDAPQTALGQWISQKEKSCYVCDISIQITSAIWTLSFICTKTAKNSQIFSKTAKASAFLISGIWWRLAKRS